jgi:hypothetical protein
VVKVLTIVLFSHENARLSMQKSSHQERGGEPDAILCLVLVRCSCWRRRLEPAQKIEEQDEAVVRDDDEGRRCGIASRSADGDDGVAGEKEEAQGGGQ